MISADQILFRCSSLVHIMSEGNSITPLQLQTIRELSEKEKRTEKQQAELDRLIAKRDNEELPEGVKTHLIDLYTSIVENRREEIEGKQLEKGNAREKDAILLTGMALKRKLKKNTERKSNEWLTGEIDTFFDRTGIDTKNAFTRIHFNRIRFKKEINTAYELQGRGYMMLWDLDKFIVSHCCLNGLASHIENEISKLRFFYEVGSSAWLEKAKAIERNHIFDLSAFLNENPEYELVHERSEWNFDIDWKKRIYLWQFDRDFNWEERLKKRVVQCRKWMNETMFV